MRFRKITKKSPDGNFGGSGKEPLFGLAPVGKVCIWLQNIAGGDNLPVEPIKITTLSGNKLDACKGITQSDFSYGYDPDIKDCIKGKKYPYGSW